MELIINGFSEFGKGYEVEQAIMDLLAQHQLLPTRDGRVIDFYTHEVTLRTSDKDEYEENGIKEEPTNIKRTTGVEDQ